jgi:NAD(P)-dependent dehydrogenase (short-subunit alcohol dehydrogenase family)
MSWHARQLGRQAGRTFVVTGANSGIGLEAARGLVGRGAHVVLAVREPAKGEQAAARLAGPGSTSVVELDLSDLDEVAGGATALLERHDKLSALICNAGVMGGPFLLSAQGFERQMATNHLGHAALVAALWPLLHASAARVVLVSSTEARGGRLSAQTTREQLLDPAPYDGRQVYRNTKQANLLFALELHRRCAVAGSPVSAVAVHPGASATNLFARQLERAGRGRLAPVSKLVTAVLLQSAAAGALPTLRALDPSTPSGAFVGPGRLGQLRGRPQTARRLRLRQEPGDGGAPVGAHRAGARQAAARLTMVDTALVGAALTSRRCARCGRTIAWRRNWERGCDSATEGSTGSWRARQAACLSGRRLTKGLPARGTSARSGRRRR